MANTPHSTEPPPQLPLRFDLRDSSSCIIRPMDVADAQQLCEFLPLTHSESDFLNYLPGEFDKTVEQEREFIRVHNTRTRSIALVVELDGSIVGIGGAASPEQLRYAHHAECGLTVAKAQWGIGIGRRVMECLIHWGRSAGLRKMYLKVFHDNARALGLYRSLGFIEEATLPGDVLRGDGTYGDTIIMAKWFADTP